MLKFLEKVEESTDVADVAKEVDEESVVEEPTEEPEEEVVELEKTEENVDTEVTDAIADEEVVNLDETDEIIEVESAEAEAFAITTQPVDFTGEIGDIATFSVNATGVASYQWQYSSNGTKWYSASGTGNKTASMDIEINATRYTLQYRCLLKDRSEERRVGQECRSRRSPYH